jgi:hypothetical protein
VTTSPGHWSDWQDGVDAWFDLPSPAVVSVGRRGTSHSPFLQAYAEAGSQSSTFYLEAIQETIMGGGRSAAAYDEPIVDVNGTGALMLSSGDTDSVSLTLGYIACQFDAADADPATIRDGPDVPGIAGMPPTPGDHTYGMVNFESDPRGEFVAWSDLRLTQHISTEMAATSPGNTSDGIQNPWDTNVWPLGNLGPHATRMFWIARSTLADNHWMNFPAAGTVLGISNLYTNVAKIGMPDVDASLRKVGQGGSSWVKLTASDISTSSFWLVGQHSFLATDTDAGATYPLYYPVYGYQFLDAPGHWRAQLYNTSLNAAISVKLHTPRWQYWIPDNVIPSTSPNWQDNSDGSWSALMDDYTGRWPLQPPPRLDTDDSVVLFAVGTPAPVGVHAINEFDGSSDPVWTTMLIADTPPRWAFATGVYGDPEPPSPVLVITVNTISGNAPLHAPDWYVPIAYSPRGAAPQERPPGQWSEWQTALARTNTAYSQVYPEDHSDVALYYGTAHWEENAFVNFVPHAQPTFDDALAAMHLIDGTSGSFLVYSEVGKAADFGQPDETWIDIEVMQSFQRWHASSFGDPDPTDLIPGAKWDVWGPEPTDNFGRAYQFEEPSAINGFTWLPENWRVATPFHSSGPYNSSGLSATVRVDQMDAFPGGSDTVPIVGTPLATVEDFTVSTAGVSVTVQPTGTDHVLVLSWYIDNLASGLVDHLLPTTDLSPPLLKQFDIEIGYGGFDYRWTTSPWRYWLVGPLVDSLRAPSTAITRWHGWGAVLQ